MQEGITYDSSGNAVRYCDVTYITSLDFKVGLSLIVNSINNFDTRVPARRPKSQLNDRFFLLHTAGDDPEGDRQPDAPSAARNTEGNAHDYCASQGGGRERVLHHVSHLQPVLDLQL